MNRYSNNRSYRAVRKSSRDKQGNIIIALLLVILALLIMRIIDSKKVNEDIAPQIPTIEIKNDRLYVLGEEMIFYFDDENLVSYTIERRAGTYYLMDIYKDNFVEVMKLENEQVSELVSITGVGYILDFELISK